MAQRILVVEDDAALGEGLRLTLEPYECTLAATLAEGRACLQRQRFDLVVLDLNLPDGSGLDLLPCARQAGGPPVLILTANDMELDEVRGLERGAADRATPPA